MTIAEPHAICDIIYKQLLVYNHIIHPFCPHTWTSAQETIPGLMEKIIVNVKFISSVIKTNTEGSIVTTTDNSQVLAQAQRLLQDTHAARLKKLVTNDEVELLKEFNNMSGGLKILVQACSSTNIDPLLSVQGVAEFVSSFDGCSVLLHSLTNNWPTSCRKNLTLMCLSSMKQMVLQLGILGALNGMTNVPHNLDAALLGSIVRHVILFFGIIFSLEK
eukprot:TRINITY_DN5068_c0_g1_i14.p1 TRINITY_DN5068_c0_g1~~TRINITY_DN5068_c0_g1_i14.p1  ORF type:complete len:218 (-),score=36.64 TRINITY_DN5068_c0_g1_i14:39-692(-)